MKLSFSKWYSIDHFKGWLENIRWGTQPSSPSGVPSVLPTFRSTGTPSHGRYKFSWKYKSLTGLWCMYLPTTHFYWKIGYQIKTWNYFHPSKSDTCPSSRLFLPPAARLQGWMQGHIRHPSSAEQLQHLQLFTWQYSIH